MLVNIYKYITIVIRYSFSIYNINIIYIVYLTKLITRHFLWGNRNVKHFWYLMETSTRDPRIHDGVVAPFIIWPIMTYLTFWANAHEDDGTNIRLYVIFIQHQIHPLWIPLSLHVMTPAEIAGTSGSSKDKSLPFYIFLKRKRIKILSQYKCL